MREAVIEQFGDGYQRARLKDKEKLIAAGLDPSILDSSNHEDDTETPHLKNNLRTLFLIYFLCCSSNLIKTSQCKNN